MASPAAVLTIQVNANTRAASTSLSRMDRSTRTSATHLGNLDKASGRLSQTLSRGAKTALGAGAAYLSLSAAKNAVQDTTDLAKVTLGLQKNMGFTVKTASELGAQLQVRGADAKQAQQVFATFGGVLHQAGTGSASASAKLAELGITGKKLQRDLKDPQKGLFDVAEGLKNVGEGAVRTDDARKLFGRGWATLAPLLRDGSAGLKQNLNDANDLGAVFTKLGLKNMQDVITAQRRMQLASLGLKISFTEAIAPAITAVSDKLADWGKIMSDPKLTNTQKFNKIATDLTNIVSKGITMAAEQAGQRAPQIAGALVKGFLNAPILGKAFLATALITKVGGSKAWLFLGKKFGLAIIEGLAGTKIGAAVLAQFPSAAKMNEEGRVRGGAMGSGMVAGLVLGTVGLAAVLGDKIASIVPNISVFSKGYIQKQFGYAFQAIQQVIPTMSNLGGKVAAAFRNPLSGGLFKGLAGDLRTKLFGPFQAAAGWITDAFRKVIGFFNGLPGSIKSAMKNVGGFLISPFRDAVSAISGFIHDIVNVINTVLGPIGVHIGGGGGGGTPSASAQQKTPQGGKGQKTPGGGRQKGGGIFVGGAGSGDKVPAMLEPGEFVLNRNAVSAIGLDNVARLNKDIPRFARGGLSSTNPKGRGATGHPTSATSAAGGFNLPGLGNIPGWLKPAGSFVLDKAGGFIKKKLASAVSSVVGGIGGDLLLQGKSGKAAVAAIHKAHPELQPGITEVLAAVLMNTHGLSITSTTGGGHAAGSYHYQGRAVDLAGGDMNASAAWIGAHMTNVLTEGIHNPNLSVKDDHHVASSFWGPAVWAEHLNHIHLAKQRGGLIQRLMGFKGGGSVPNPKHGAHWIKDLGSHVDANEAATLLWQAGLSEADAGALSRVVPGESGGNVMAHNKSGATGLFQILGSVFPGNLYDPRINAINAAIKWRTQGRGAWEAADSGSAGHILRDRVGAAATGKTKVPKAGKTPKGGGGSGSNAFDDALQAFHDINDPRIGSMNELIGEGNLEALQRYQVGASQNPILGLGKPGFPSPQALLSTDPTLDDIIGIDKQVYPNRLGPGPYLTYPGGRAGITGHHIGPAKAGAYDRPVHHHTHVHVDGKEIAHVVHKQNKNEARRGHRPLPSSRRQ